MDTPKWWQTSNSAIQALYDGARKAEKRALCQTPGGRDVLALAYGPRPRIASQANYSSACGAHNRAYYAPLEGRTNTVVLIGAVHAQETEGVAAIANLISLLETGKDLAGGENPGLLRAAEGLRVVLVPIANPDGRARVEPDSMVGLSSAELRHWGQGNWADGSLCGWPECKARHPMRGAGFLGGYFNDAGVNLMHDNFFHPMAAETQALLDLCAAEFASCVLQLHGGSNSANDLLQPNYVPREVNETVRALALCCDARARREGLWFTVRDLPGQPHGETPPSFNLVSALHHVCGAVSACFESNEGLRDGNEPIWDCGQILRSHMILFEETFKMFAARS